MVFDIIILAFAAFGLLAGLIKGLVKEALGLIGLVLSFLIAKLFAPEFCEYIHKWVNWHEQVRYMVSWLAIFVAVALVTSLLSYLITKAVQAIQLGFINRLLGAVLGAVKYVFIISLILNLYNIINVYVPLPLDDQRKDSKIFDLTVEFAPILYNTGKDFIDNDFHITGDSIKNHESQTE